MDSPTATRAPPTPPAHIKPTSQFSPRSQSCCQCNEPAAPDHTGRCSLDSCGHQLCHACPRRDARGSDLIAHAFPVHWICSSCSAAHSVLEILTARVGACCGEPSLQAVYDQFGKIFLYWRDDPAVYDLNAPEKVAEAAWRIWQAGGSPWLPDVVAAEAKAASAARKGKWNRFE
jgi:hypothetical protein